MTRRLEWRTIQGAGLAHAPGIASPRVPRTVKTDRSSSDSRGGVSGAQRVRQPSRREDVQVEGPHGRGPPGTARGIVEAHGGNVKVRKGERVRVPRRVTARFPAAGQRAGGAPRHRLPRPGLARTGPRHDRRPRGRSPRPTRHPDGSQLRTLAKLLADGQLEIPVASRYRLADAAQALAQAIGGHAAEAVILMP
jgi:hypothetical protein